MGHLTSNNTFDKEDKRKFKHVVREPQNLRNRDFMDYRCLFCISKGAINGRFPSFSAKQMEAGIRDGKMGLGMTYIRDICNYMQSAEKQRDVYWPAYRRYWEQEEKGSVRNAAALKSVGAYFTREEIQHGDYVICWLCNCIVLAGPRKFRSGADCWRDLFHDIHSDFCQKRRHACVTWGENSWASAPKPADPSIPTLRRMTPDPAKGRNPRHSSLLKK